MKDNAEKQPSHPELLDCPCWKEGCAIAGCFFANALQKVDPEKLGVEKAEEVRKTLLYMANECGCINLPNLKEDNIF